MSFNALLQLVKQGDPVSPGTVNGPLSELDQNLRYLWEIIQAAELGSTVYARQVTVEAAANVGMPVYLDSATQTFRLGLAQMETDRVTGLLLTAASSQVFGIVAEKHNATSADLLLFGYTPLDISQAVGGDVVAGTYYLSGVQAGKLTRQRPPVSVPVLRATGDGTVFVNPQFVDFIDSHRHYRFDLNCSVAGDTTPPATNGHHVITNPNANLPGWLPADHASFAGLAPAGAAFGYNLKQHTVLNNIWPPLPINQVYLEWLKDGDPSQGLEGIPLGTNGQAVVDRNGIWWLSDCYGDVPWPKELTTDSSVSESIAGPLECPRQVEMQLTLWFTKINFATDSTVVTSLHSTDSRLVVRCSGTNITGSTGDLEIDLDLDLTLGVTDRAGYLVVKTLEDGVLQRGPVSEGVYATSGTVLLTSPFQTRLVRGDSSSPLVYHGPVGVGLLPASTRELSAQTVRLQGATEEHYPTLYLGMASDIQSEFVVRFDIPADAPSNSHFIYRCRIIGRAAGNLPQLIVTSNIVARPPDGLATPITVSATETSLTIVTVATLASADTAVEASSSQFSVNPGDVVFVHVIRNPSGDGDGYAGELGIMQQVGILTS